ncbi:MAG: DUF1292 domain-containing protein [Erysipelotrichaceae bacterium]|nr:DUF1292 domain-containing protein [Erysipelotrichaceae bacterium]MBO4538080.1 DUF1292 domain-containing protein [Erysipelotrichaceae bacterium]MBR5049656.1 DUF1292 domain-containing protein [Erysipelotrichaceae bacterium]
MDENKITVTTEDGTEREMTIYFTFHSDEFGKSYVVFYDEQDPEAQAYAMSYDEEGNLEAVENENEWEMIEEVFEVFENEESEESV